jgi:putative aldouronate transport system permease protein
MVKYSAGKELRVINRDRLFMTIVWVSLIFALSIMVYPFYFSVICSISINKRLVLEGNALLWPKGFTLLPYRILISSSEIIRCYGNTIFYAITATFLNLIINVLTAYPLTLKEMPGRKIITVLFTLTLFIGGGLIPYYILIKNLGLDNNFLVMIIPGALSVWNIIIFKTFFQQLPAELTESAIIDGANDAQILRKVILPLSKPIIATFAVFGIVAVWNDFFTPMLFLSDHRLYPLQTFLRKMLIQMDVSMMQSGSWINPLEELLDARTLRAASVVITVLPIAIIYPFFQKYFDKGILLGSLKE